MLERLIGEVKGIFNTITLMEIVISLICIVGGLVFFTNAALSNVLVSIITGIILILNGCIYIISFLKRNGIDLFNYNIFYGITLIIVGVLAMIFQNVLSIMIGIYFIIAGIQRVNYGVLFKKFNESSWLLVLVIGVLYAVIGIITLLTKGNEMVQVVGVCLLGYGLINLINTILLRKRSKYFLA